MTTRTCPHGLQLKEDEWCGECIRPNLLSDILPFALASSEIMKLKDNRIEVISGLAKIGVHQMSHDVIVGVLRMMVRQKMIKSFTLYPDRKRETIVPSSIITIEKMSYKNGDIAHGKGSFTIE